MSWFSVIDKLPPRGMEVIVLIKPKRKNSKPFRALGAYWTPGKGHDADTSSWATSDTEDVNVIAWTTLPPLLNSETLARMAERAAKAQS